MPQRHPQSRASRSRRRLLRGRDRRNRFTADFLDEKADEFKEPVKILSIAAEVESLILGTKPLAEA